MPVNAAWVLATLLLSAGCSAVQQQVIEGAAFRHVVLSADLEDASDPVHLYIAGDGRPFVRPDQPAADPTVPLPLAYELMIKDEAARVLLGRPCYHGMAARERCSPGWWTQSRYSEEVVQSMVVAAQRLLRGRSVLLIGHSGGGALALLMAARLDHVAGVVTIGANLDIHAWADWHGYTKLSASLQPLDVLQALQHVPQQHYWGSDDQVVPPASQKNVRMQLGERACVVASFDHQCCWRRRWSDILARFPASICTATAARSIVEP